MFKRKQEENAEEILSQLTVPAYGYELIREVFLKNLLGKDYDSILYWGGKNLARKYPLQSIQDITVFFETSGWGILSIFKERKNELIFELKSDYIENRFNRKGECSFQLEAGFLAEQIQNIEGFEAEAMVQHKKRENLVLFTVQWD